MAGFRVVGICGGMLVIELAGDGAELVADRVGQRSGALRVAGAILKGSARFDHVTFKRRADFRDTTWEDEADFVYATFEDDARFEGPTTFKKDARFDLATWKSLDFWLSA